MDQLVSISSAGDNAAHEAEIVTHTKNHVDRSISDWVYAGNTSNQSKFGSFTLALATTLSLPTFPEELATAIAKKLLQEDMKAIYRALTAFRQAQTIPMLNLSQQIARFVPQDLFTAFDFTSRIIPKSLSQQPYRQAFLQFYIELVSHSAPQTRRELFAHRRIFSGWIGKLGLDDDEDTVKSTMSLLYDNVLKDTTVFTKTTKMGLFNDWTLKNMQRLLASSNLPGSIISETLTEQISRFSVLLFCDWKFGVRMPGENRLALSFLKILKPWENVAQMDMTIRLLRDLPDVSTAYFESLASTYTLTPKQSMWWFSYSVLHVRVLKLPFQLNTTSLSRQPKVETVSKQLVPPTITKAASMQSLQFDSNLVKFQAAQIILFAVRRLSHAVTEIYKPNRWDSEPLIEEISSRLPDINLLTKPVEPQLSRTTYSTIVKEVCQLHPLSISISMPLDAKQVSGLESIEAETVLEVATYTSDQTKWWSPSKDRHSLFTQLVQFATFNPSLANKSSELLQHLVRPTQSFADMSTLAHPVDALLFILTVHNSSVVWSIIEQAIQRATRSPYQYIDKVKSTNVSPFAVASIEQWDHLASKHGPNEDLDNARKWLLSYIRSLIVVGEDREIYYTSVSKSTISDKVKSVDSVLHMPWKSDEYFDFVLDASDNAVLKRQDLVFKISNRLELAATLFRSAETGNENVRNHLLASIPADLHFTMVTSRAAYSKFIEDTASPDLCRAFLATVDDAAKESPESTSALEHSNKWTLGSPYLSTEFSRNKLMANESGALELSASNELNARGYQSDPATMHSVLSSECTTTADILDSLAANLELWAPKSFNESEASDSMMRVNNSEKFVASLIRVSGRYPQKHPLGFSSPVLVAAARFAPQDLDSSVALGKAKQLIQESDSAAFAILNAFRASIPEDSSLWILCSKFIEKSKHASKSVLIADLSHISTPTELYGAPQFLGRYLKIVVHQLTRQFAEKTITNTLFLHEFNNASESSIDIWQHVHHNAINALLEAALRFDHQSIAGSTPEIYRLVSVISSYKSAHQATLAQLTTLFESRKPGNADLDEVTAIHFSFSNDKHESNATSEVEQASSLRYSGTSSAKDRLLLSILQKLESSRQRSWMESMQSVDVRPASQLDTVDDYGLDPLVAIRNDSLYITLDEQMIRNTIQTYEPVEAWPVNSDEAKYATFKASVAEYEARAPTKAAAMYDTWFLSNFIVSAKYLYENFEVFSSSGLISFVLCCLSAPGDLSDIALTVSKYVHSQSPEAQFKDQVGLRLLLGKVLMTQAHCQDHSEPFPSHIPGIVGQIAHVLTKPNHFMHEKVAQWSLAGPQVQVFDIPLFKAVSQSSTDLKMREMIWIVNTSKSGAIDASAVQTYIRYGVMEWCLSQLELQNSRASASKEAVHKSVDRIEELGGVSESLASRSGMLVMNDLKQRSFYTADPERVINWVAN